jgi:hypothetical protein
MRPENEAPLYFSFLCSLFFSCHNFSFLFLPFVTHCTSDSQVAPLPPTSSVFCMDPSTSCRWMCECTRHSLSAPLGGVIVSCP